MKKSNRRRLMFVTGASGFLGRHLLNAAAERKWQIFAPPSNQLDVCQAESVMDELKLWKPTAVVHLAYRKNDPRSIVIASANVAAAAAAVGARLVHLSTDVVFGGRPRPYVETDTRSPITDYGRWKAAAEDEVLGACPDALVVRTSLIYGTDQLAPVQLDVRAAATGRSTMSFFTDEVRCPVNVDDLATAVAELAARREVSGALHIAGPQPLDRATFARLIARSLGHDPSVLRTSTIAESGQLRPAHVVLDIQRATALGIECRPVAEVFGLG